MFSHKWVNNTVARNFNENLCKDFKKHISIFLSDVYTFYTHFIMTFRTTKNFISLGCSKRPKTINDPTVIFFYRSFDLIECALTLEKGRSSVVLS